jgi:hypothetical protein
VALSGSRAVRRVARKGKGGILKDAALLIFQLTIRLPKPDASHVRAMIREIYSSAMKLSRAWLQQLKAILESPELCSGLSLGSMQKDYLTLRRASAFRPSGEWNDDDFDVLADGEPVGRTFQCRARRSAVDVDADLPAP